MLLSQTPLAGAVHAGTTPLISLAIQLLGGVEVPLTVAAKRLGWTCQSRAALEYRRRAGTLPVTPIRRGNRWFVTAAALAVTLAPPPAPVAVSDVQTPKRGPGRPPKTVAPQGFEGGGA